MNPHNRNLIPIGKKVGILGAGQLAKMLCLSLQELGLKVSLYSSSSQDPAVALADEHHQGSFENPKEIKKWIQSCDYVSFESEFFDLSEIKSKKIKPSVSIMNQIRDRYTQKKLLEDFKIPSSPFELASELKNPKSKKPFKASVFKKRLFGYDGYGTVVTKSKKSYEAFLDTSSSLENWIREDFIPFKRELAFSVARNAKNQFCFLPLVESKQVDSKCFWVKGPVASKKISPIYNKFKKMMKALDYQGLLSVELFETQNGELLVNELAPRVHNSAHYSIEALSLSQFDLHSMALLSLDLPKEPKVLSPFAMVNLIGKGKSAPKIQHPKQGKMHWYKKSENRKGRKMGHITLLDQSPSKALKEALKEEKRQEL